MSKKKKICLLIEKSFDKAAINFNKVSCDLFKFRSVTTFFISLIKLDIHQKYQIKEHTCNFKIDKITYSKSSRGT